MYYLYTRGHFPKRFFLVATKADIVCMEAKMDRKRCRFKCISISVDKT